MAITVNIYYTGENTNAREFAREMISSGTVEKIRAERGNIRYEYFYPMDDEKTILLIDKLPIFTMNVKTSCGECSE